MHSFSTSFVLWRYHFRPSQEVGEGVMGLIVGLVVGEGTMRAGTGFKVGFSASEICKYVRM